MKEILLLVIGAVIAWLSQWLWYRYVKRDERRSGPNIIVNPVRRDGAVFAELHNIGPDNVKELTVTIRWLQDRAEQVRTIENFFSPPEKPAQDSARHIEYLAASDRVLAADIPTWSDDGIVTVKVQGLGVQSDALYETESQITVGLRRV